MLQALLSGQSAVGHVVEQLPDKVDAGGWHAGLQTTGDLCRLHLGEGWLLVGRVDVAELLLGGAALKANYQGELMNVTVSAE